MILNAMDNKIIIQVINNTPRPVKIYKIGKQWCWHIPGATQEYKSMSALNQNNEKKLIVSIECDQFKYFRSAFLLYTKKSKAHQDEMTTQLVRNSKKIKYKVWGEVYNQQKKTTSKNNLEPDIVTLVINTNKKPIFADQPITIDTDSEL